MSKFQFGNNSFLGPKVPLFYIFSYPLFFCRAHLVPNEISSDIHFKEYYYTNWGISNVHHRLAYHLHKHSKSACLLASIMKTHQWLMCFTVHILPILSTYHYQLCFLCEALVGESSELFTHASSMSWSASQKISATTHLRAASWPTT